ncbi:hypothetical protein ABZ424_04080 [Streptomyces sp. NPDC005790]|uniref:hypothetical protein n=1 Tax=Streptomyces sp. NPDC005790 TaxID=3154777 RepID=UPI0033FB2BE2
MPTVSIPPVSTRLVRKALTDQVLLTGWGSHGEGVSHTVLAAWPLQHALYTSQRGVYHPLLLAETIRMPIEKVTLLTDVGTVRFTRRVNGKLMFRPPPPKRRFTDGAVGPPRARR